GLDGVAERRDRRRRAGDHVEHGLGHRHDRGYCTTITFAAGVASKISFDGQVGQVTPSSGVFGSPSYAKAPMLFIIALERSSRPGWFAVVLAKFESSDGPKLPNWNGRSKPCAAP